MTQYVQLSPDATKVIAWFAGPQSASDKPGYAAVDDADARYVAWQAAQAAQVAAKATLTIVANVLGSGVQITSTSASALNGTYAVDPATQPLITSEAVYIQATGAAGSAKFTNGQTTKGWPDLSGTLHTFTTAQFIAFAEAVAQYIDAVNVAQQNALAGGAWVAPSSALTIA